VAHRAWNVILLFRFSGHVLFVILGIRFKVIDGYRGMTDLNVVRLCCGFQCRAAFPMFTRSVTVALSEDMQ
jgi:hypothetical protein